jgi:hypothetical protein
MIGIASVLALLAFGLAPAYGANRLEDIGVSRDGDSVVVTITTAQPGEFQTFLTEARPERIVIDLSDVTNDWPSKTFRDLPLRSIESIRTSQFKTTPELIARVVLDIGRPIDFRSYREGNNVIVRLPVVPDETEFASWQAGGRSVPAQPAYAAGEPAEVESTADESAKSEAVVEEPSEAESTADESAESEAAPVEPVQAETTSDELAGSEADSDESAEPGISEAAPAPTPAPATSNSSATPVTPAAISPPRPNAPGVQVETAPKRKTIEYNASVKDPFMPLVGAGKGQMVEGLPSLENLKLVGILEDREGNRALLEDGEGNGYILRANDRIRGGYVVSVADSKVIFQVTEYGWTRTVALELEIPEIK